MENSEQINSISNAQYLNNLPNASVALTLGILSIVLFCCCFGIIGLILGIIGLILGNKAVKLYREETGGYTESSYKNANAGRICAIIGIILGVVVLISGLVNLPENLELIRSIMDGTFDPDSYLNM